MSDGRTQLDPRDGALGAAGTSVARQFAFYFYGYFFTTPKGVSAAV
jgi:hypothetical protein